MKFFEYVLKPEKKLKADFSRRKGKGQNSFEDFQSFMSWYNELDKKCHYCGLLERESQKIAMTGILKSSRFPQNGKLGRGQSRGVWLEVDRIEPKDNYSSNNCVLSCYFCNNDKSDIFHGEEYNKFKSNRLEYLRSLLSQNNDIR